MKYHNIFILHFTILFCACQENHHKQNAIPLTTQKQHKEAEKLKHNAHASDTLFVDTTCAVITQADTSTIDRQKKQSGDDFYVGADDDVYYSGVSEEFLHSKHVKVLYTDHKNKYVKFVKNNGTSSILKLDTLPGVYNIYLFKPSTAPYHADMTTIEDEYKRYFTEAN
jgi:hypothetical protein